MGFYLTRGEGYAIICSLLNTSISVRPSRWVESGEDGGGAGGLHEGHMTPSPHPNFSHFLLDKALGRCYNMSFNNSTLGGVTLNSSWIKDWSYDSATGNLDIETKAGESYTYGDVPESTVAEMEACDSLGTFHNENLRNDYICVRN